MVLSADELVVAQKAYTQVRIYKSRRRSLFSAFPFLAIITLGGVSGLMHRPRSDLLFFTLIVLCILLVVDFVFDLRYIYQFKSAYADNLRILKRLEWQNGGVLPEEVMKGFPEVRPLFERWLNRSQKRAILWRLDALLSGKSTKS